jgi:hypothetical protein
LLVREIAAASGVLEEDNRRSQTPPNPDVIRLSQESDIRLVMEVVLGAGTVNVKVWLKLPVVASRMTHPVRDLEVVNCTLAEVAPASILTMVGIVNAELVALSFTTDCEDAGVPSEMRQLPEIPGVRTVGVQESDKGLGAAAGVREMVAVKVAVPKVAVMTASCAVVIVAADAVKVAEGAFSGTVRLA